MNPKQFPLIMYHCSIKVIKGSNIPLDDTKGYPYITIDFESTSQSYKSRNIHKTSDPEWNDDCEFDLTTNKDSLFLKCFQKDVDEDVLLGCVDYDLEELETPDEVNDLFLELPEGGVIEIKILVLTAEEAVELASFKNTMFFQNVENAKRAEVSIERDYIIIVDKSTSMSKDGRWEEARDALFHLTPFVCQADPDGITLYFFSSEYKVYNNVVKEKAVQKYFKKQKLSSGTNLYLVLKAALEEHFNMDTNTTILVITDGAPDDKVRVKKLIEKAGNKVSSQEELSITFIQIGNSRGAREYLEMLDDDLTCTHDIVDTITCTDMKNINFSRLIYLSVTD